MTERCPVCDRAPYVEKCQPWPAGYGQAPWAVGCYHTLPVEHFVGVNGNSKSTALAAWSAEVATVKRMNESARPALSLVPQQETTDET